MEQRRRRISIIRRRTVGGALATFAVVWAAIFFQLTSGHDPALSNASQPTQTQTQTQPQTPSEESPSATPAPSEPLDPVTTSQS
jgi:hypothetical protein